MIADAQERIVRASQDPGLLKPLGVALGVHLLLMILVGLSFQWPWQDTGQTRIMKARVVDVAPPAKAKPARPVEKEKPKAKPLTTKDKRKDKKKAAQKQKQDEARKRKEAEERRKQEDQKRLQEMLQQEEADIEAAARAARAASLIDEYKAAIRQKVSRNWIKPVGSARGMQCVVRVRLVPGGEVLEARVVQSSGNAVFDRSVESAVYKAAPLPLPDAQDMFDYFREIEFTFNPEA